ncbi:MAG TPA: prenyltransferase/squalene oxidase repeat-containing protein [Luteolibacter sp.]|nr:prenyltransferase/squalene oxidase repeat-containing protein [Luteolibacter sp.]
MSLHAQLSPEALARLHRQRRNSTISSIAIAILTVALVAMILGIFLLPALIQETPTIVTYKASLDEEIQQEEKKMRSKIQRKPTPAASSRTKVIVANTVSPTAIQVPDIDVTTPSLEFGDMDLGSSWGGGGGPGGFSNVPASMKKRCSPEDRLARLNETGGTPECEEAVEKALEWFQATQSADGSWTNRDKSAMTGLALLAYLGRCETPLSVKYGDTVLRAITYLVNVGMQNDGRLSPNIAQGNRGVYEHAIATYALAEATTFCQQARPPIDIPNLLEVTRKAGQFIIDNQNAKGGWAYMYAKQGGHVDTSVTAWQIQALKACEHTGLQFKGLPRAAGRAMDYMETMVNKEGGVGYNSAGNTHAKGYFSMTGGGLLSLQMFGKGSGSAARRAAKYIEENTRLNYNGPESDLYGHYYEAQAMMNRGGAQWRKYNEIFRDQLLQNQNPDGSWKAPNGGNKNGIRAVGAEFVDNVHYRTALATLTLEVYYRFLPGTGAGM